MKVSHAGGADLGQGIMLSQRMQKMTCGQEGRRGCFVSQS